MRFASRYQLLLCAGLIFGIPSLFCNWTELKNAVIDGDLPALRALLNAENLNAVGDHGRTLLFEAVNLNRGRVTEILLSEKGADPNIPDEDGWTPLYIATLHNNKRIVPCLLSYGADPVAIVKNSIPLRSAVYWKYPENALQLIAYTLARFSCCQDIPQPLFESLQQYCTESYLAEQKLFGVSLGDAFSKKELGNEVLDRLILRCRNGILFKTSRQIM